MPSSTVTCPLLLLLISTTFTTTHAVSDVVGFHRFPNPEYVAADALVGVVPADDDQHPTVSNLQLLGRREAFGIFESEGCDDGNDGGDDAPPVHHGCPLGYRHGLVLSTGAAERSQGANVFVGASSPGENWYVPGDPLLDALVAPEHTVDAAVLEFDFVCDDPAATTVTVHYAFGTDEDTRCAPDCAWNDAFGIFLNDDPHSLARLSDAASSPVTVNTVGAMKRGRGVHDNSEPASKTGRVSSSATDFHLEADLFTDRLLARGTILVGGATNHLKIVIADTFAMSVDSWAFLEMGSLRCA